MPRNSLPPEFKELEPFGGWALAKETERSRKRLSSTIDEMRDFYHAMIPRGEQIFAYLNRFSLDELPADARRLFFLTLSLAEVSFAVEIYGKPEVTNSFQESGEQDRLVPLHE